MAVMAAGAWVALVLGVVEASECGAGGDMASVENVLSASTMSAWSAGSRAMSRSKSSGLGLSRSARKSLLCRGIDSLCRTVPVVSEPTPKALSDWDALLMSAEPEDEPSGLLDRDRRV